MLGYVVSALAYSGLLLGCLTVWRRRLSGSALPAACCAQVGWACTLAVQGATAAVPLTLLVASEYVRGLAWIIAMVRCLEAAPTAGRATRNLSRSVSALFALFLVAMLASLQVDRRPAVLTFLQSHWLWGGLTLSIAGLVLVEQVARNTRSAHEWHFKHVWLAIGGLFAWDLCFYSTAMLQGGTAPVFWKARGFVDAALGAVLALGLRRIPAWRPAAFLSPRLVFFNATLLGAAVYVFAMSAASFFVRNLGGSWGPAGQVVFLGIAAIVLAIAVLSEQFRAWLRVMLAKHLFPYRYDYRQEWLRLTRVLSERGSSPVHERIVSAMASAVNSASGGLWVRDADGAGAYGPVGGDLAPADGPHESGFQDFFDFLRRSEWICDLEDLRSGTSRRRTPAAPDWLVANPRIRLVVPLICDDALVGFVAIGHPLANMHLTWEEIDLLRAAGRQVASHLALEETAKSLAEAHQFEALNRLSAVLMHDLRHLIAQQALVVENAARHRGNPQFFDDAILTIENSVKRMTRLMEELRSGVLAEQAQHVELADLAAEVLRRCRDREPLPQTVSLERGIQVVLNRERMLQILEHVVRNAQEATSADGRVTLGVRRSGNRAVIEVVDTGTGMDAEFIRNRLFRPFDTTKGERGMGIGAYQAREFVRKCGGNIDVESAPGQGTTFIIRLPVALTLAAAEHHSRA